MSKFKDIIGWTDYPFVELGDVPGELASVRKVKLVSFDGDKYVDVLVVECGIFVQIKRCYFYTSPGRCGEAGVVPLVKLEMFSFNKNLFDN